MAPAEIARAQQAIASAEATRGATEAPSELRLALSKLVQAQTALGAGEEARAARLAREASVDARLAEALVIAGRSRTAMPSGTSTDFRDAMTAP